MFHHSPLIFSMLTIASSNLKKGVNMVYVTTHAIKTFIPLIIPKC
jgi:hypothetical protein